MFRWIKGVLVYIDDSLKLELVEEKKKKKVFGRKISLPETLLEFSKLNFNVLLI